MPPKIGPVHLVLLHSNDIHGAFAPEIKDGIRTGGLSMLSGYVHKTKREEKNVLYVVAGDMFMGSIIDSEYRGLSTIRMANALEPDAFAVGNHEVDYGLSHLLFLEKCADFPILCANMYVRELNRRLFSPSIDIKKGRIRVRMIALLTETISDKTSQEELVDSAVRVRDVKKELDQYFHEKHCPADLTVLVTHLGIEEDRILAASLSPDHGVDLIIGGHSHTLMEEPEIINGIPVVQAGSGSSQIGRFDLYFGPSEKKGPADPSFRLTRWEWRLVPINERTSEPDPLIDFYTDQFQELTDKKYETVLCTLPCAYTHPWYHRETELMDFFTDLYQKAYGTDLFIISSNALRTKQFGPVVRRKDLLMALPYDNEVFSLTMDGRRLESVIRHFLRREAWEGAEVFFLFSGGLRVVVRKDTKEILSLLFREKAIEPDRMYTLGITSYARKNIETFLGIPEGELGSSVEIRRLSTNDKTELEACLASSGNMELTGEDRLRQVETDPD